MRLSRRIRPALVVNAALATSLLAVTAAGDSVPSVGGPQAVERPVDDLGAVGAGVEGSVVSPDGGTSGRSSPYVPSSTVRDAVLAQSLPRLVGDPPPRLSVAVASLDGEVAAAYGADHFDTASIVKVDILAALLLMAQDEGRELTARERLLAEVMIQRSDNDAADELWLAIGEGEGLDAANERLGLVTTVAGPEGHWGLTQTTAVDQLALLRAIHGTGSPLHADSRAYLRALMATVVPDQRWGISAAADGGVELKNGWLPRSRTGLWDVNSIGRVTVDGRPYLVAVVSDGHVSWEAGVAVVEAAAEAALSAVTTDQAPRSGV
ncbi:serine hydrolase [Streptomyces radicis]|uniref:Beta-lactamase class A catalytic domain-containing protein n=1 Tax=Streptomyces radicis TaxID=1750517 RepID=A0A3A9X2K5_9ACTN|nr:serine hydrolase [Streptomyces radicis]RKN12747.1 hypothetical protein D7319_02040 [Streptomyces radicis]RKN27491.1 hypothetical protein D7318_00855 [Streptomyces radicis]